MITLEYLNEFEKKTKNYDYEIKRIVRDIKSEERKTTMDSVTGSSSTYPYIEQHYKINGKNESKINKLEKRKKYFENKKKKLVNELEYKLKKQAEEDSILADIIRLRYIQKLEWKQIAMNCNFATEAGPRLLFNRYFDKK